MKRNLFFMYAISFFQGMVFYSSVATLYRLSAGLSVFHITLIESISLALSLAFEIPWGILADRIGYRRTMIACSILFFISKIVFWRAQDFAGFLLERVLLSIVLSGLSGVDASILYLSCREGDSQCAFGIYESLGTAGLMLAAAFYAILIGEDYRTAGFLTVISYSIAAALSFGLKEVKAVQKDKRTSLKYSLTILKETLTNRCLIFLIVGVALLSEVNQMITVFFSQLQYMKAGMSVRLISGAYILITVSGLVSAFSAFFTKKLKPGYFGTLLFTGCGLACLLLAFTENALASVTGILLVRVCFSLMSPLGMELQNKAITTDDRATALSMSTLIMDLLAVFTNLVFGRSADFSLSAAMCLGGIFCIFGMILYLSGLNRAGYSG